MSRVKFIARRISPYQYKVPSKLAFYLTERLVCTILLDQKGNFPAKENGSNVSELSLALMPENVWLFHVAPQIENLSASIENKLLQRLAFGYNSTVPCVNQVIDLSRAGALISYLEMEGYRLNKSIIFIKSRYVLKAKLF